MDCTEASQEFLEALDGALSKPDLSRLREHLDRCGSCRAEFERLHKGWNAVRIALPELAPRERYLTTARLERLMNFRSGGRAPLRLMTLRRFVAAAAVAIILVSGFFIASDVVRMWEAEHQEPLIVLDWLGVAVAQDAEGREGLEVKAVLEDSPAHAAGLRPADVLLQVEDRGVDDPAMLAHPAFGAGRGGTIRLQVLRGDRIETVPVAVDSRPTLLYAGAGLPAKGVLRLRWRKTVGAFRTAPAAREAEEVRVLREENEGLRERIRQLEQSLNQPEPAGQ